MTQIIVDKDWMIEVDNHFNFIPHRWKEVKKRVEGSRDTVPTGEFAWHSENKFFPNEVQALRYIFQQNILDNVDTVSIQEYIELMNQATEYFYNEMYRVY